MVSIIDRDCATRLPPSNTCTRLKSMDTRSETGCYIGRSILNEHSCAFMLWEANCRIDEIASEQCETRRRFN